MKENGITEKRRECFSALILNGEGVVRTVQTKRVRETERGWGINKAKGVTEIGKQRMQGNRGGREEVWAEGYDDNDREERRGRGSE